MTQSWCLRGLRAGLRGGFQAAALATLLAGCSVTDSVFGGGASSGAAPEPVAGPAAQGTTQPAAAQPGATQQGAGQTQSFPNLGTVPNQPPATSSTAERQQIASGLVADNQNAAYSDQPVTAQQSGAAVAPPAPAPTTPAVSASAAAETPAEPASTAQVSQSVVNQPMASPPAATSVVTSPPLAPEPPAAVPQPVTPPLGTAGATPLAPPPNPVPPAPAAPAMAPPAMTNAQGAVVVDTSQFAGSPLPGYAPVLPGYAAAPYIAPGGVAPAAGQPIAVIFFADASAGLSSRDQWVLRNVSLLQQQQGGRLRIVGHASQRTAALDPARHDQVNEKLSAKRANTVARALIGMGVPQGSIGVVAEGSRAPLFYEFMPTGEAGNRRVEIYLDR
jgi:outer membrane protein OmpA-like peptidoglycan-associated protein